MKSARSFGASMLTRTPEGPRRILSSGDEERQPIGANDALAIASEYGDTGFFSDAGLNPMLIRLRPPHALVQRLPLDLRREVGSCKRGS
jgi:hypothetical protein